MMISTTSSFRFQNNNNNNNNMSSDVIKRKLFETAITGDWIELIKVVQECAVEYPDIHAARLTAAGDTALHLAIAYGQVSIVESLVEIIRSVHGVDSLGKALETGNDRGNTPLHLAAAQGNIRMCRCIASVDLRLVGCRNLEGETPLFSAALHGRNEAFFLLHRIVCQSNDYKEALAGHDFCRRNDGETILHCAIAGEYFDLAFQIIYLYGHLVHSVNKRGISPLHLLASKPSAFNSGSHLRLFPFIIYHCISVHKLVPQTLYLYQGGELARGGGRRENFTGPMKRVFYSIMGLGERDNDPGQQSTGTDAEDHVPRGMGAQEHRALKLMPIKEILLNIFGPGSQEIINIRETKKKHVMSVQVFDEIIQRIYQHEYLSDGRMPLHLQSIEYDGNSTLPYFVMDDGDVRFDLQNYEDAEKLGTPDDSLVHDPNSQNDFKRRDTPILIAAKNGITEMVRRILQTYPVAIQDMCSDGKNLVLLAVENRQPHVYQLLLNMKFIKDTLFRKTDEDGNSALHLAATLGEHGTWLIPAVQMQWEIKWFENSLPIGFFARFNNEGKTPEDIFTETHQHLVKSGADWLTNTSQACSFVGALVATVAFATCTTFPGGTAQDDGTPTLKGELPFDVFAISSLVALCFSVTSVVMFLNILASRYQAKDFRSGLPQKLLIALTSLFVSITSMLVSFCAGHFFLLRDKLKHKTALVFLVYALACFPAVFAIVQFPLYIDIMLATLRKTPHRNFKVIVSTK